MMPIMNKSMYLMNGDVISVTDLFPDQFLTAYVYTGR